MQEVLTVVFAAVACVFSFVVGKVTQEKKGLKNEIEAVNKGAAAGDAAVRAFRVRQQNRERSTL